MLSFFQRVPVHVKIFIDKVEATNLLTGETVARPSTTPFSASRMLIADYNVAENCVGECIKELNIRSNSLKILIQPKVELEGGLYESERRCFRDLCEQSGAVKMYLLEDIKDVNPTDALALLKRSAW